MRRAGAAECDVEDIRLLRYETADTTFDLYGTAYAGQVGDTIAKVHVHGL